MTHSALGLPLGPEFDNFLFAVIGEGTNGGLVSVLSALARLDLDPWNEAAKLAQLPPDTATSELVSFIAAQPAGSLICPEPATTAYRLVALLPRKAVASKPIDNTREKPLKAVYFSTTAAHIIWLSIFILMVISVIIIANPSAPIQNQTFNAPEAGAMVVSRHTSPVHINF